MNCIIIDDDLLSRKVLEGLIEKSDLLNLVGSYESPVEAFKAFDMPDPIDLIFLDAASHSAVAVMAIGPIRFSLSFRIAIFCDFPLI